MTLQTNNSQGKIAIGEHHPPTYLMGHKTEVVFAKGFASIAPENAIASAVADATVKIGHTPSGRRPFRVYAELLRRIGF